MSGASGGTVGVNKVAKEHLDHNVPRTYKDWAPGGRPPRLGNFMEVPFRFWGGALLLGCLASGAAYWLNRRLFSTTVSSMTPEFQEAARRIGPVAERSNAPPVFLNPIFNRIPGRFRGPDDIEATSY